MCAVSMVSDWGMKRWPDPYMPPVTSPASLPVTTQTISWPPVYDGPTRQEWEDFKKLILAAIKIDELTGQPDCVDPKKEEWMQKMSEYYDEAYGS